VSVRHADAAVTLRTAMCSRPIRSVFVSDLFGWVSARPAQGWRRQRRPIPAHAVELGKSVCPMPADSSQSTADVASKVADMGGMSLGPATMFTGLAVSIFCPAAISNVANGQSPIPLSILGE